MVWKNEINKHYFINTLNEKKYGSLQGPSSIFNIKNRTNDSNVYACFDWAQIELKTKQLEVTCFYKTKLQNSKIVRQLDKVFQVFDAPAEGELSNGQYIPYNKTEMNQDKMRDCGIRSLSSTMRYHTALFLTDINAFFNQQHLHLRFGYLQPKVSTFKTNCGTYGVKNIADRIICKQDTKESDLSLRDYYKEDQYTKLYFDSFNAVLFNHNLKSI